jgi:beta-phosphoglucomutase
MGRTTPGESSRFQLQPQDALMATIPQYAAIWDVDGTLVDTAEMHFAAWVRLCGERGRPFSRADFAATFGKRNSEILPWLFGPALTEQEIAELGNSKEEYYKAAARAGVQLLPGVQTLLTALRDAGFKQAIGSSAPRANVDLILELTQTAPFFQAISSAEDTTRGKPDPQVFEVAAQRLGMPPSDCVVFEDAVAGVHAAKAGGMKCVAITFVGHHPADKLHAAGADLVVRTLEQLSVERLMDACGLPNC